MLHLMRKTDVIDISGFPETEWPANIFRVSWSHLTDDHLSRLILYKAECTDWL